VRFARDPPPDRGIPVPCAMDATITAPHVLLGALSAVDVVTLK